MKRIKKALLTIFITICVLVMSCWVVSPIKTRLAFGMPFGNNYTFGLSRDGLRVSALGYDKSSDFYGGRGNMRYLRLMQDDPELHLSPAAQGHAGHEYNFFGITYSSAFFTKLYINSVEAYSSVCIIPYWHVLVLFGAWPARQLFFQIQRRLAKKPGFCPHCGYDLRAGHERCPECGNPCSKNKPGVPTEDLLPPSR